MKYLTLLFTGFYLLFCTPIFGQDKMLDRNGNESLVKVIEITPDSIFYKTLSDSASATTFVIPKAEIFMITFKNGTKELFPEATAKVKISQLSKQEYYRLGKQDASTNFRSNGAFWGTFGASLVPVLWPAGGLATGAAVSLSNPDTKNVLARNPEYKQNADYLDGYNNQAKKKKLGSAAGGFGAAVGLYCVAIALLLSGGL